MLMDAVDMGFGTTLQPWAAVGRYPDAETRFHLAHIDDPQVGRQNLLCSLSDDELSPAALALRVVLADTARGLVRSGGWRGTAARGAIKMILASLRGLGQSTCTVCGRPLAGRACARGTCRSAGGSHTSRNPCFTLARTASLHFDSAS
jgi:hypothetical protein